MSAALVTIEQKYAAQQMVRSAMTYDIGWRNIGWGYVRVLGRLRG